MEPDVLDSILGPLTAAPSAGAGQSAVFEANLRALAAAWRGAGDRGPRADKGGGEALADRLRATPARRDVVWVGTEEGLDAGSVDGRALCSQRRPGVEAQRLMERVDIGKSPVVVVTGFGVGWHVAEIARRLGRTGVVVVFEPDVALLRAVLERLDHSAWIAGTNLIVLTDADDQAGMARACAGIEHALALGLAVVEHPGSAARLGDASRRFVRSMVSVMEAVKTTVLTTMVQTEATLRNLTQNLDHYALGPGIAELRGSMRGRAAVCVAAGPSLSRSMAELERWFGAARGGDARGSASESAVLIGAQTVLRPLLARGVRPHFVTALDYHEVSARFYEGLTREMVEGVTLIVEPKVNPAVTSAFAGVVRCAGDDFLDELLGPELRREMGKLEPGATVAHLSYHLARYMGCDPVILVGQDLGFTDGQYYGDGAAIHDTWACELNEFNTLEMMEWQRVARHRGQLTPIRDVHGRWIYTDSQMHAYLVQFEAAFAADAARGLTTIDATEGGAAKVHTTPMPLAEAMQRWSRSTGAEPIAAVMARGHSAESGAGGGPVNSKRRAAVAARVRSVRGAVAEVVAGSREAARLLEDMRRCDGDQAKVGRLIDRVYAVRDRVTKLAPAFSMIERLNQTGAFRRVRADRAMYVGEKLEGLELQRRQIERDIDNVTWLADAGDALGAMLDDCSAMLGGAPKHTRDPGGTPAQALGGAAPKRPRVWAVVPVLPRDGLGRPTDATATAWRGRTALSLTLDRLARCRALDGVVVLAADVDMARRAAGSAAARAKFIAIDPPDTEPEAMALRGARLWASACWRGGLGGLTCYDEVFTPGAFAAALKDVGGDGALIVGPDWAMVDPALCDAVIERYRERPEQHRLVFTQAGVGLCGAVADLKVCTDLAKSRGTAAGGNGGAGAVATIGGMLGYVPISPRADALTGPMCVGVRPAVRDAAVRCVADDVASGSSWLLETIERAGLDVPTATAEEVARAVAEACDGRPWPAAPNTAEIVVERTAGLQQRVLAARGDGRVHAVQVRVPAVLACSEAAASEPELAHAIVACGAEVVSVDCWRPGMAVDEALERSGRLIESLLRERAAVWGPEVGLRGAWIVPRLMRCEATLDHLERWYDYWLMRCGSAVIDAPAAGVGGRVRALTPPRLARRRAEIARGSGR